LYNAVEGNFLVFFIGEKEKKGVILGTNQPMKKEARWLRHSLEGWGVPILTLPVKEAETISKLYNRYLLTGSYNEKEWYRQCQEDGVDYITVRRALGLEPKIGQQKQVVEEKEIMEWLKQNIFSGFLLQANDLTASGKPVSLGVWGNTMSRLTRYVIEEAESRNCYVQLFVPFSGASFVPWNSTIICKDRWKALEGTYGLLILDSEPILSRIPVKEWAVHKTKMRRSVLVDPYNLYESEEMEAIGYRYIRYGCVF